LVYQPRGTQRYQPTQRNDEDALTRAIIALASQYGRYGYRRITIELQEAGWQVGKDRVERIWRREGLKVPQKQKPRGRLWLNDGSCVRLRPERPNHVWTYDFVSTFTQDGRTVRMLNLIDEYTRECLAIYVSRRISSNQVIEVLAAAMIEHGIPEYIRSDNGPEFVARALRKWLAQTGARTLYIEPGSPWENGYCESFNSKLRDEFLNGEIFYSLKEVKVLAERWRVYYNTERPHSSLGYRPPAPAAWQSDASQGHGKVESKERFPLLEWSAASSTRRIILVGMRRLVMDISTLGIDLSKTTFHVIGFNAQGEIVLRRKFSRKQLLQFTSNRQQMVIGMEACGGAHFLSRALQTQGHDARLMPAQFVKPFRKSNKNDYLDAEAIAEAVQRPTMRFVPIKTDDQLDLQALHRVRDRWVARRTAVMNQIRGFLMERGITIRKGPSHLTTQLQGILEDGDSLLSGRLRRLILELKHEWDELDKRIEDSNAELQRIAKQDDACHRLMEIPGFGPLVSTALVAAIGNGITFRKGRDLSAWLGLVPRQHSTGGKTRLLGISKRGNEYLRRMFLHGARSVVAQIGRNPSALGLWLSDLSARSHRNVTVVALANKMARTAWAILSRGTHYCVPSLAAA
jgi:transposase/transposase InsO family protein